MKRLASIILLLLISLTTWAQATENVILITLDGLRWQELFSGADSLLINNTSYVKHTEPLSKQFWHADYRTRRATLMPFMWKTIATDGQLYGNRKYDNKVDCSNGMWFSYPGYNEILTGFADDVNITSNDKTNNPNTTVLEYINNKKDFKGKVYAFGSWDVFPYIINEERSGIPVNAGFEASTITGTSRESFLNELQKEIRSPWGAVRLDVFTHHFALETLKKKKPRLLYIAYGETDDFAHDGRYDEYLKSAHQTDAYIKDIWDFVQSDSKYRNKTTLIITTDHGRGTNPLETWKSHGSQIADAGEIWLAIMGPDTPALGEVKQAGQYYQNQVAATVASYLGFEYDQPKAGKSLVDSNNP